MATQNWNPEAYAQDAGFVAELGEDLIGLLAPRPGEIILDLGCGDGALTEKLLPRGCRVVAVDASAEQVAAARARGLDARVMDGHALAFEERFDGVVSNAALHWMKRPREVLNGVRRALQPRGRFVAEMGGAGNVRTIVEAAGQLLGERGIDPIACNPWYFPDPDAYGALLEASGFRVDAIRLFERPTPLPGDVENWLRLFAQSFAAAVPDEARDGFYRELSAALEPRLRRDDGTWYVDYVRLRFRAVATD